MTENNSDEFNNNNFELSKVRKGNSENDIDLKIPVHKFNSFSNIFSPKSKSTIDKSPTNNNIAGITKKEKKGKKEKKLRSSIRYDLDNVIQQMEQIKKEWIEYKEDKEFKNYTIDLNTIEIFDLIGSGGSGANVYTCNVDGFRCAVKVLSKNQYSPRMYEQIEKEIDILYNLPRHTHIAQYLFHQQLETGLYLYMQYYDSTLLYHIREVKAKKKVIDKKVIVSVMKKICDGVRFLHQNNIIHRDLKSENIFINYKHKKIHNCAIGDFDTALNVSRRNPKSCVGTTGYIAPEVLESSENNPYNKKSDIYSIGMILYEMMELKIPYHQKKNPYQISQAILAGEKPILAEFTICKYKELIPIYEKCIDKDPEKRYSIQVLTDLFIEL